MHVLITSAASELAHELAAALSGAHQIRLTDLVDVETEFEFVRSDLGHEEGTDRLVEGTDAIIHLAQLPSGLMAQSAQPENLEIDFQMRGTYNLLRAACDAQVSRFVYASDLHLFDLCDENWAVTENWRPRLGTAAPVLSRYLGEFVCREFAREGRISIACLRLGTLIRAAEAATQPFDGTWLERGDAMHAFECSLKAPARPWAIFHIQSEFPNSRFSIDRAKEDLNFNPQFTTER